MRAEHDCCYMNLIAIKDAIAPFRGARAARVCFAIAGEKAWFRRLGVEHSPAGPGAHPDDHGGHVPQGAVDGS